MNSIIEHQNDQKVLDRLCAQHNLYNTAKRWRNLRFLLCVLTIVVLSFIRVVFIDNQTIAIVFSLAVFLSLLLGPMFNKQISRNRTLAARIQQLLETELFEIPWDENLWGPQPTAEDVYDHKSSNIPARLYDWYDKGIGVVQDHNAAVLLCQRENMNYDSHIRASFTRQCLWLGIILCIGIAATAFFLYKEDVLTVIMFGLIPITPIVRWIQSVRYEDERDKGVRSTLGTLIKVELDNSVKGRVVRQSVLKQIQNYMFIHRKEGYLVPGWYYCVCREKSEDRAAYSVQVFLAKYKPSTSL